MQPKAGLCVPLVDVHGCSVMAGRRSSLLMSGTDKPCHQVAPTGQHLCQLAVPGSHAPTLLDIGQSVFHPVLRLMGMAIVPCERKPICPGRHGRYNTHGKPEACGYHGCHEPCLPTVHGLGSGERRREEWRARKPRRRCPISITTSRSGSGCSEENTTVKIPFLTQRLKRWYTVLHVPYCRGKSRQGAPVRAIRRIPSIGVRRL